MKYILINDLYTAGGTEVQSLREANYFMKKGHEILYITFDHNLKFRESKHVGHINLSTGNNLLNRYITNKRVLDELKRIIKDFQPDFIHLNNTYLYSPTVYKAVKDYYCVQTIRDYAYVCVKSTCIFPDCSICRGIKYEKCIRKCMPHKLKDFFVFFAKHIALNRNNKLRKKCVNKYICPSQKLTDFCNNNGYNTVCINNPFDFSILEKFKKEKYTHKKIYLYYGMVAEIKGILKLIEAFKDFSKDKKNVELHIIGRLKNLTIKDLECNEKIRYFEPLQYNLMLEKLQNVYAVVVPSVWMENYPNTVLEGFATECIVLASNRGGMVEQIRDNNRIFDVMNKEDILRVLNYSYYLTENEKDNILREQKEYLKKHNTQELYYQKILSQIDVKK